MAHDAIRGRKRQERRETCPAGKDRPGAETQGRAGAARRQKKTGMQTSYRKPPGKVNLFPWKKGPALLPLGFRSGFAREWSAPRPGMIRSSSAHRRTNSGRVLDKLWTRHEQYSNKTRREHD